MRPFIPLRFSFPCRIGLCVLLLGTSCVATTPTPAKTIRPNLSTTEAEAHEESLHWLQLIDTGQYGKSWRMSAQAFKRSVSQDAWIEDLRTLRFPLGSIRRRSLTTAKSTSTLPAMPDGQYIILLYSSAFSKKHSATETITCVQEHSGEWKVVGYFIK